jgi:subtilisin-like proprotein convertase family protein
VSCVGFFKSNDGIEMPWKVKDDGMYEVTIEATGTSEGLRLWPEVIVLHENEVLAKQDTMDHKTVTLSGPASAGNYAIHVQDVSATHIKTLTSGVHFNVTIKKTGPLPAASASASASGKKKPKAGDALDNITACSKDLSLAKAPVACTSQLDAKGVTFTWKVEKKAAYMVQVIATGTGPASFSPKFTLVDAKGKKTDSKVDDDDKSMSAIELEDLAPGTYKITVNDSDPKHAAKPEAFAIAIEAD